MAGTVPPWRGRGATGRLIGELMRRAGTLPGRVSLQGLSSLPAPVEGYFRTVLQDGQPFIRFACITQAGEFRIRESPDPEAGWRRFEATQHFTAEPPGFVWDARIRMAPFMSVRARDAYVGGRASMHGSLLGMLTVVNAADDAQLRTGALQRYLAESVWFPTALLPRDRLRWTPVDDSHAIATLLDGETSAALEFEFGPNHEIVSCYTPGRPRADSRAPGRYVTSPWGGRYRRYDEHRGVRAPLEAEVYWVVDGKERPYYRGRNLRVEYDIGEMQE